MLLVSTAAAVFPLRELRQPLGSAPLSRMVNAVILRCIPLALLSFFWLLSHLAPFTAGGDPSTGSAWMVFSVEGQLGWLRVDLTGPSALETYGVTADTALDEFLAQELEKSSSLTMSFSDRSDAQTLEPGRELDRIQRRIARVGWLCLIVTTLVGTLWSLWQRRRSGGT